MESRETGSPTSSNRDTAVFATRVHRQDTATIIAVRGEVDMFTSPTLGDEVNAALDESPAVLVIDLTAVRFLGSAGLAALVEAQARASRDTAVRIVAGTSSTTRILRLTGLDHALVVYPTVEEAIAGG